MYGVLYLLMNILYGYNISYLFSSKRSKHMSL